MRERLVKGINLVEVVKLLRAERHTRPLPEIGTWEQDLLRKRVSPTTWYSVSVFDSLLQLAHRFVFDGSEAAAQMIGRRFATTLISSGKTVVIEGDPLATLERLQERWRHNFNFGEVSVNPWEGPSGEQGARLRITGFPDMSACHGYAIVGWCVQMAESAGAKDVSPHVEERPWMHNSVLTCTFAWKT